MSQRNPMNDRYTTDEHQGKTRKSAAAMKPKTKAAASVRMQPTVKTKQQKKAAFLSIFNCLFFCVSVWRFRATLILHQNVCHKE